LAAHSKIICSTFRKCSPEAQSGQLPTLLERSTAPRAYCIKGITTDPEKLEALRVWPTPNNKNEIRSFLCLCTYYRRVISGFTNIVKPLNKLMEKQAFQWTPEVDAAFQTVKKSICTAPVLAYP
jgi:hypothetical protein